MKREIKNILVTDAYPLRKQMLNIADPMHEMDSAPLALHLGAFADDQLVGVVSLFKAPMPVDEQVHEAWQVWGLLVEQKFVEQGYADALLQACIGYSATNSGKVI